MMLYTLLSALLLFESWSLADDHDVLIHNKALISPTCTQSRDERKRLQAKFHSKASCDGLHIGFRDAQLKRQATHRGFMERATYQFVPDQRTVVCPAVVQDLYLPNQQSGYNTDWIVENTASTPVVLAWIDPDTKVAYSVSSDIHPPQADPESILQPGDWRHIYTFQGHVFYAFELLPDGNTGRVLLQHRTGLIPIGEKHITSAPVNKRRSIDVVQDNKQVFFVANKESPRVQSLLVNNDSVRADNDATIKDHLKKCSLEDPEPTIKHVVGKEVKVLVSPAFQREPAEDIDCHQMFLGFRNRAGCPLHGYYVDTDSCHEIFTVHLGVKPPHKSLDFHHDWSSDTAFEFTFVGHSFVFRSPSDPSIIVDQYDIRTTQVVDCPLLQEQQIAVPQHETTLSVSQQDATNSSSVFSNSTSTLYERTVSLLADSMIIGNRTTTGGKHTY